MDLQETHRHIGVCRNAAFTLIELSIVLVVIGLLVGGILVGRDLIKAAEIRSVAAQIEQFNTAVNVFRNKYDCLPGDCAHAGTAGFDATSNGNGDGIIGYSLHPTCDGFSNLCATEQATFWYHLNAAGLIADAMPWPVKAVNANGQLDQTDCLFGNHICWTGLASPKVKLRAKNQSPLSPASFPERGWTVIGAADFITTGATNYPPDTTPFPAHSFVIGYALMSPALAAYLAKYAPSDLYDLDAKIDDALPFAGSARAMTQAGTVLPGGATDTGRLQFNMGALANACTTSASINSRCVCTNMAPPQYSQRNSNATCGMIIKSAF